MRTGHKHVFNEIFIPGGTSFGALSSPALHAVFRNVSSLDISQMRNGHHHFFIRNHIFYTDLTIGISDFRTSGVTVLFNDFSQLLLDNGFASAFIRQDILEIFYGLEQCLIFLLDLQSLKSNKALESHLQDRLRLSVR